MFSELARNKKIVAPALVFALGGLTTACGESNSANAHKAPNTSQNKQGSSSNDIKITYTFTPTGKRLTHFDGDSPNGDRFNDRLAFCEGTTLVDQVAQYYSQGGSGGDRIPNDPACADGKLDATDFALAPK
jgi:hypothetical protein